MIKDEDKLLAPAFLYRKVKRLWSKPEYLSNILKVWRNSRRLYNTNYYRILKHSFNLLRANGFNPIEAYELGLMNPNISDHELNSHVSCRKLWWLRAPLNPHALMCMTDDKAIFYRHCEALGLPTPKLYAVVFRQYAGWSYTHNLLNDQDGWVNFIKHDLPDSFVVKPSRGMSGSGVHIFTKCDGEYRDETGQICNAEQIYEIIAKNENFDCYLLQERMKSHADLIRLSNSQAVQTVRIVTLIDQKGECQILYSGFKVVVGNNLIDNICRGATGNLWAPICTDDGRLAECRIVSKTGLGPELVLEHPDTGVAFKGFKIPFWEEVCNLAKEAAINFLPLRTVGWDIGVTDNGPYLVEGNTTYATVMQTGDLVGKLLEARPDRHNSSA